MKKINIVYFESNLGFHVISDLRFPGLPSDETLISILKDCCFSETNVYAKVFYLNDFGDNNYICSIYGYDRSFTVSHVCSTQATIHFFNDGKSVLMRQEL